MSVGTTRTISESVAAVRRGALRSVDLVAESLARIDAGDRELGAFTTVFREEALAAAGAVDAAVAAGEDVGPLAGIPLGVKDIIASREAPASASSTVVDPAWWAGKDAPAVARLRAAGAVILGKTTTMEYALGEPDETQALAQPRCAWDHDRWAGGSSSGSGSGVAAGMLLGAIGTDTGGSVRLPAAFNGITGHKPTFGLVPKSGVHALGYTLDAVGPLARTVEDCALLLDVLAGYDRDDPYSVRSAGGAFAAALSAYPALQGVRIGVDVDAVRAREGVGDDVLAVFEAALAQLRSAGAELVPVTWPDWRLTELTAMVGWQADALDYHRAHLASDWSGFGRGIRTQFIEGMLLTPADIAAADRVRRSLIEAAGAMLAGVDVVVSPTIGRTAVPWEERSGATVDAVAFTAIWNLTGGPATSVPMGFADDGLPLGLQIAGRAFDDARVLRVADAFQRRTGHHLAVPATLQAVAA